MVQSQVTEKAPYLAAFEALEGTGANGDPQWVDALRKEAISRFEHLGFPTARRGNEEWKYTDVGSIARIPFSYPTPTTPVRLSANDLERFTFGEARWHRLVFVDGAFQEHLSSLSDLPLGVSALNLADAMVSRAELAERHLGRHADYSDHAFTALNTAFLHDGAFVHISDGTSVKEPIHLLFLTTTQEEDAIFHPRVLVITGEESKATLIESHGSLAEGRYLSNAVSEVTVGPGASLKHYRVQRHSEQAFHVGTTQVELARDSAFASVAVDLSGGMVRNNLNVLMDDEGCSCMLNGVYLVTRSQHVDNQVIIDHAKPHTTSRELYKGILDGKSRAVFHGSIIVRPGAQKVDARQEDKNLLLSAQAEADTKPAFWIYADDVKCAHGASSGQLDENALFYLRSRGLAEGVARAMLVRGFVAEVIDTIPSIPFRAHVEELVSARLREL